MSFEQNISNNLVDSFIQNKKYLLGQKIDFLKYQTNNRYYIWKSNIYGVYKNITKCGNKIFQIEATTPHDPLISEDILNLERQIMDLEKQKSFEDTSFWSDSQTLNKELLDTFIEYQKAGVNKNFFSINNDNSSAWSGNYEPFIGYLKK